jgi:hypothetical protein
MTPETFIYAVIYGGPLLALVVVVLANRHSRSTDPIDAEPTSVFAPGAAVSAVLLAVWLTSAVLYADVPAQDPCSLLEPYSWQWWLIGCYWGSAK